MGGKIKPAESLYIMSERIGKITGENKLSILRSLTSKKENILYARKKIISERLDKFREIDEWNYKTTKDGTVYTKAIGKTKYYIIVKHGKIIDSKKTIDDEIYSIEDTMIDKFKKYLQTQR